MKSNRCITCGCPEGRHLFIKGGFKVQRCQGCSLIQVRPQPTKSELKDFYSKKMFKRGDKYAYTLRDGVLSYAQKTNDIARLNFILKIRAHGSLLDVGCGPGFFLYLAKEHYGVSGVDYSPSAAATARTLGLNVIEGEICDTRGRFDVITMWDVLEHVTDPLQTLKDSHDRLKKGGLIVISTGDVSGIVPRISLKNWALMTPPMHLFFFSPKTIRDILVKSGFEVRSITHPGKVLEVSWILFKIADTTESKFLMRMYEAVRDSWIGRLRIYINTRDIMTVVATSR